VRLWALQTSNVHWVQHISGAPNENGGTPVPLPNEHGTMHVPLHLLRIPDHAASVMALRGDTCRSAIMQSSILASPGDRPRYLPLICFTNNNGRLKNGVAAARTFSAH
jgi:hypothetical protein